MGRVIGDAYIHDQYLYLYFIFSGYNSKYTDKQLTRITNNKNFRYGNTKYQTAPKDYPKETVFLSRGSPNWMGYM